MAAAIALVVLVHRAAHLGRAILGQPGANLAAEAFQRPCFRLRHARPFPKTITYYSRSGRG
jgi:hypothetical protein